VLPSAYDPSQPGVIVTGLQRQQARGQASFGLGHSQPGSQQATTYCSSGLQQI
jgi:hypothetical protein